MWMASRARFVALPPHRSDLPQTFYFELVVCFNIATRKTLYLLYLSFMPTINIWNAKLTELARIIGQEWR